MYEIGNSPDWLLASQALGMFYKEFGTKFYDQVVFHDYVYNGFSSYFSSQDVFFRTLGTSFKLASVW